MAETDDEMWERLGNEWGMPVEAFNKYSAELVAGLDGWQRVCLAVSFGAIEMHAERYRDLHRDSALPWEQGDE